MPEAGATCESLPAIAPNGAFSGSRPVCGLILGAARMRHYINLLDFEDPSKSSGDSSGVPLLTAKLERSAQPWSDGVNHLQPEDEPGESMVPGCTTARMALRAKRVRDQQTGEIATTTTEVDRSPVDHWLKM